MRQGLMANADFWRADLFTITLLDGTIYHWTTCDVDLSVGGNVFAHVSPVLSRSALRQSARLQVDTLDVALAGAYQLSGSSVSLLAMNGYFDDARLKLDHLVMPRPGDVTTWGTLPSMFEGRIALADPTPTGVQLTVKSEVEALNVQMPRYLFSFGCMHAVYDANCGVSRAAKTVSGTVATPAGTSTFNSNRAEIDNYFNLGVVTFNGNVTAALAGVRRAVASYAIASGAFALAMPLPVAPASGDTFTVYPGCSKTQSTCNLVFSNLAAFRGFPHTPITSGGQ